jgi:hypothetical protein
MHEKKFVAFKDNISSLLYGKEVVSARNLARTVGRIISMSFALGNIWQIMTRNLQCTYSKQSVLGQACYFRQTRI